LDVFLTLKVYFSVLNFRIVPIFHVLCNVQNDLTSSAIGIQIDGIPFHALFKSSKDNKKLLFCFEHNATLFFLWHEHCFIDVSADCKATITFYCDSDPILHIMRIPQLSTSLLNYLCLLKRQTKPYTDIMNSFLASSSPLFDMAPDYENVRIPKTNLVGKLDVAHTLRTLATVAKEEQEKENQNLKKRQLSDLDSVVSSKNEEPSKTLKRSFADTPHPLYRIRNSTNINNNNNTNVQKTVNTFDNMSQKEQQQQQQRAELLCEDPNWSDSEVESPDRVVPSRVIRMDNLELYKHKVRYNNRSVIIEFESTPKTVTTFTIPYCCLNEPHLINDTTLSFEATIEFPAKSFLSVSPSFPLFLSQ